MITQKELMKYLTYNPETGYFLRNLKTAPNVKEGQFKGTKHPRGYLKISVRRVEYLAHRLAWLYMSGEWPKNDIDHLNHDRMDNRFCNLRLATRQENMQNTKLRKGNKTGLMGVSWDKKRDKWSAQITVNYKNIHLGRYNDFFLACCIRKSAEKKYNFHNNHGDKAA